MIDMGMIKIELNLTEITDTIQNFKTHRIRMLESLAADIKSFVGSAFNQLLKTEMTLFLGNPEQSDNKKNGYKERDKNLRRSQQKSQTEQQNPRRRNSQSQN